PATQGALVDWSAHAGGVRLRLRRGAGEAEFDARLLVLADGGGSTPADHAREYGQHALVAEVAPVRAHRNVAWERFTREGPIALLPFGERLALVWSAPTATVSRLLALSDAEFLAALHDAFGARLGGFARV